MRRPELDPRNQAIVEMRRSGATLRQTGERFGVTKERVRQIVAKVERMAAARKEPEA